MALGQTPQPENWDDYYRRYQEKLAERYLLPTLREWNVEVEGKRVLEVGGGDGGCGAAFSKHGAHVVMVELEERLAQLARDTHESAGLSIPVYQGDITDDEGAFYREGPFDIVMFRDVMEHIDDPVRALDVVRRHLAPGGVVYNIFPPYFSPYGAHQQILPRRKIGPLPFNKLPYLQLLPRSWFLSIVQGDTEAHKEVQRLRSVCLTLGKFHKAVDASGFKIREKRLYLSRPTFALRYGIPVIRSRFLGEIPLLNELLTTGAYYLLEPRK